MTRDIDLVTFTGSVSAGKKIAERVGYRRLVLELGGNDPLIVMGDADLDRAAQLAVQGATKNSGNAVPPSSGPWSSRTSPIALPK